MPRRSSGPTLSPEAAWQRACQEAVILYIRPPWLYAVGHPASAVNIIFSEEELAYRVAQVLPPELSIIVLGQDEAQYRRGRSSLRRQSSLGVEGCGQRGYAAWKAQGLPAAHLPETSIHDLCACQKEGREIAVLDVREEQEWRRGHIPGALHIPLRDIEGTSTVSPPPGLWLWPASRGTVAPPLSASSCALACGTSTTFPEGTAGWQHAGYPLEVPQG
jgi:hydroxyacylglutathione hydrolase